jgi:hypothetical protein
VDAANVYWAVTFWPTEQRSGQVLKVPIAGGTVTTLVAERTPMTGIAVNGTSVIWSEWSGLYSLTPK